MHGLQWDYKITHNLNVSHAEYCFLIIPLELTLPHTAQ